MAHNKTSARLYYKAHPRKKPKTIPKRFFCSLCEKLGKDPYHNTPFDKEGSKWQRCKVHRKAVLEGYYEDTTAEEYRIAL
jgi:hypothetical protein